MYRYVRMLAAAIMASATLLVVGVGPTTIPEAAAAVCPTGQNQAFVTLHSSLTWLHYRETYSGGGYTTTSGLVTILSAVPAGRITYTFCVGYASGAGWTIKKAPDVIEYAYYGMDSSLHVTGGTGFALRATYINTKSLTIEPTMCKPSDPGLEFLKFTASLPIPGVNYAVSVGVFIVGSLIPSGGTTCQAFGDLTVPISFLSSNGNTTASAVSDTWWNKVPYKLGSCNIPPNACWDVDEYRWSVTP